jgi:hypothetical protein
VSKLADALGKSARARGLLSLVDLIARDQSWIDLGPNVKLELVQFRDKADQVGRTLRSEEEEIFLRPDDLIAVRVHNFGASAVDVTLLHLAGQDYALRWLPSGAGTSRIPPRQSLVTPRQPVTSEVNRLDHLFLIAVEVNNGPPISFACLTHPTLAQAREATDPALFERAMGSPFGQLLQNALYAEGSVRGLDTDTLRQTGLRRLTWQTVSEIPKGSSR